MITANTVADILRIPSIFYDSANSRSFFSLLQETSYFKLHQQVNENDFLHGLIKFPDLVDDWFLWSENKRTDSGWYITQTDSKSIVGYFTDGKVVFNKEYDNKKEACAAFIKNEIEEIRTA